MAIFFERQAAECNRVVEAILFYVRSAISPHIPSLTMNVLQFAAIFGASPHQEAYEVNGQWKFKMKTF